MRRRARARLTAQGVITRPSGPPTLDGNDEAVTPPPTIVWAGPCSIAPQSNQGREATRGDRQIDGREWQVAVTVSPGDDEVGDSSAAMRGDTFTATGVDPVHGDPAIIGVPMSIEEVGARSRAVLRRLRCLDTAGTAGQFT